MLLLLKNYALAPAFRLKCSVIPVATRHFLTTSPNHSPSPTQKTGDKPKRFLKKDLSPPTKRPLTGFVRFIMERVKKTKETSPTPVPYADTLRECSAAWKKLSNEEKKPYSPPPGAYEEYKASTDKWYEGLSVEAKRALKIRRMRKTGTGFSLFVSETWNDAKGDSIGTKVSQRAALWKSFSPEKKAEYTKRARETLFGIRARRTAQRERELERAAQVKIKAAAQAKKMADMKKKAAEKEMLRKRAERMKEKAQKLKEAKARKLKEKAQKLEEEKTRKLKEKKALDKGKKQGSAKKQTTKAKTKVKTKA